MKSSYEHAYRLRVETPGGRRCFIVKPGANRIGSAESNEVMIGAAGLSRHHACLEIAPDGVFLEDLGSRNGTRIEGRRVTRASVKPGEEVRLGPVAAWLEDVDPGDAELALRLDPGATAGSRAPDESTEVLDPALVDPMTADTVRALSGFFDRLASSGLALDDLPAALGLLVRQLDAEAAALVEWHRDRGAVVVAAHGDAGGCLDDPVFHELIHEAGRKTASAPRVGSEASPRRAAAYSVLARREGRRIPLGLTVRGRVGGPSIHPSVTGVLVRLFDLALRGRGSPPGRLRPEPSKLAFPEDWAPSSSAAMERLYGELRPLVASDLPVLIEGETGVGKERVASILHVSSHRRGGPFVAVNCAAVPAELLEAEMFGIGERVATGVRRRPGRFREADGGTLFLDEIGDMSPELQARLLRVLQEKEVQPLGEAAVAVDVRVVAATNVHLVERVGDGGFRRDLYYRVAGSVIRVPSLDERREDVPALVEHFLRRGARDRGKVRGKLIRGVTAKALGLLSAYSWPGNVRELEHEVERLITVCPEGDAIDSAMLAEHIRLAPEEVAPEEVAPEEVAPEEVAPEEAPATPAVFVDLETRERQAVAEALHHAGGNQVWAARLLGITRSSLRRRIQRFGLGSESSVKD